MIRRNKLNIILVTLIVLITVGMIACAGDPLTEATYIETLYVWDGGGWNQITTNGAGGDVSAAANLANNTIIRGDGGAKGVQDSGCTIDDTDKLVVAGDFECNNDIYSDNDLHVINDAYIGDNTDIDGDLTTLGTINFPNLPAFANNAAAVAGGLAVGDLYRTNGDPDLVCVVH